MGFAGTRHADRDGVGPEPALDGAERRDQEAARDVYQIERYQTGVGRHLGPVTDASEMPGATQRDHRDAVPGRLRDAEFDGLRPDGLAETEIAVDHRQGIVLGDDRDPSIGEHFLVAHHLDVTGHADDAVAVVSREVRLDQTLADARSLRRRAAGGGEDGAGQALEIEAVNAHRELPR